VTSPLPRRTQGQGGGEVSECEMTDGCMINWYYDDQSSAIPDFRCDECGGWCEVHDGLPKMQERLKQLNLSTTVLQQQIANLEHALKQLNNQQRK